MAKRTLTSHELDAQTAVELPNRDMMLVTVIVNNVLNDLTVTIDVSDINIAVNLCNVLAANPNVTECHITQS